MTSFGEKSKGSKSTRRGRWCDSDGDDPFGGKRFDGAASGPHRSRIYAYGVLCVMYTRLARTCACSMCWILFIRFIPRTRGFTGRQRGRSKGSGQRADSKILRRAIYVWIFFFFEAMG